MGESNGTALPIQVGSNESVLEREYLGEVRHGQRQLAKVAGEGVRFGADKQLRRSRAHEVGEQLPHTRWSKAAEEQGHGVAQACADQTTSRVRHELSQH